MDDGYSAGFIEGMAHGSRGSGSSGPSAESVEYELYQKLIRAMVKEGLPMELICRITEFDEHEIVERHNDYPKLLLSLKKKYGTAKMRAEAEALERSQVMLTEPLTPRVISDKERRERKQNLWVLLIVATGMVLGFIRLSDFYYPISDFCSSLIDQLF